MGGNKKYGDVLVYDVETYTPGPRPDGTKDQLRLFGCYSYKTGKYYNLKDKEHIQNAINGHKYLVGFNNQGIPDRPGYDNPVLKNAGIFIPKDKVIVDLMGVFKSRANGMKIKKGMLGNLLMRYSLKYITETLDIVDKDDGKLDIDYNVFKKPQWTPAEWKEISEYLTRDIEVTKKLYEWVEDYFWSFRDFLRDNDVEDKVYLTGSIAKVCYKAICKEMNWKEEYTTGNFEDADNGEKISGGYVAYPAGERFEGDIYCLDYNSLYPHIMIQCNLSGSTEGTVTDRPVWYGQGKWKVEGTYYADELTGVGKLLKKWYADRVVYKKAGDRREYTLKIFINTIYGILNNRYYTKVYDKQAAGDCTRLGRQWTKYARKLFRENGYKVIYTDTDSVYIIDVFNDKEKMLSVKDKIIKDIKDAVPFPQDTFDMGIDDEIKFMFFFKGKGVEDKDSDSEMDEDDVIHKPLGYMKKNYVYVCKSNKAKVKNLGLAKKSISPLTKKIFWEHLVPQIIEKGEVKFSKTYLRNLIQELLEQDLSLAALRKEVGVIEQYEKSKTGIQAQISQRYGAGIHFLIANNKGIGVGKGVRMCNMDEFKEHKLQLSDIDLHNVWSELDYFIKPIVHKNIFQF